MNRQNEKQIMDYESQISELEKELKDPSITPDRVAEIESAITELKKLIAALQS